MNKTTDTSWLIKLNTYLVALIFVLVPFHALFTTWMGSNFGHLDLFRIWKELLMIPILVITLYIIWHDKKLNKWFRSSSLIGLLLAYVLLSVGLGLYAFSTDKVNSSALIYGLLINTRFLLFFFVCIVLSYKTTFFIRNWIKLILWPAISVVFFGILQKFILPNDFLTHFGYSKSTIVPFQTVDQKPEYVRLQSTLRGPNPLGAYLVLILTVATIWLQGKKSFVIKYSFILPSLLVLFFTYSRSAWLGLAITIFLIIFWSVKSTEYRSLILISVVVTAVTVLSGVFLWRQNNAIENTFFHTDNTSKSSISSNEARTQAIASAAMEVINEPFGRGPGTAGPASVRNNNSARISENYYLQIGQELGVVGMLLFIAIVSYVGWLLWLNRQDSLSLILLASLIGLSVINLVSHAWTDDTLSYLWWGLAGIALSPVILKLKGKNV